MLQVGLGKKNSKTENLHWTKITTNLVVLLKSKFHSWNCSLYQAQVSAQYPYIICIKLWHDIMS